MNPNILDEIRHPKTIIVHNRHQRKRIVAILIINLVSGVCIHLQDLTKIDVTTLYSLVFPFIVFATLLLIFTSLGLILSIPFAFINYDQLTYFQKLIKFTLIITLTLSSLFLFGAVISTLLKLFPSLH
jgi:hypothetical protein